MVPVDFLEGNFQHPKFPATISPLPTHPSCNLQNKNRGPRTGPKKGMEMAGDAVDSLICPYELITDAFCEAFADRDGVLSDALLLRSPERGAPFLFSVCNPAIWGYDEASKGVPAASCPACIA
mmetsp:Transcript_44287/g.64952  ORF Transcript_44287/g.64952 Transcript_44287/m.64952 type:complete len:123 (+) Transcript_44287:96-464(+)